MIEYLIASSALIDGDTKASFKHDCMRVKTSDQQDERDIKRNKGKELLKNKKKWSNKSTKDSEVNKLLNKRESRSVLEE